MKRFIRYIFSATLMGLLSSYAYGKMDHLIDYDKSYKLEQDLLAYNENLSKTTSFIDSIQQHLTSLSSNLEQLDTLYRWTIAYSETELLKSMQLAKLGQQNSQHISNQEWETKFNFEIASNYTHMAKYDSALVYYAKIISDSELNGDQYNQAKGLEKKGFVNVNQGNYTEAIQLYFEALNIFEALENQTGIAQVFLRISVVLGYLERYQEGVNYGEKALYIFEERSDSSNILLAYQYIADNYLGTEKYNEALIYTEKSLSLAKKRNINPISMASLLNTKGNVLKHLNRYEESIDVYKKSNKICTDLNHPGGMSATLANISDVYMKKYDYQSALTFQKKSFDLANEHGWSMNIIENTNNLSNIYRELNDFENALKYREQNQMFKDSILSVEKDQITKDLTAKYETDKKETLIASQEEQLAQKSKTQNLTLGIVALLASLLFGLIYNYRKNKIINIQLNSKNKENELLLKEIHHRVKNNLQTISSLLSLQSESINDKGAYDAVNESRNRVTSMALIHQKLYQGKNLAAIEMRDYFETIGMAIIESFGERAENISLEIDMSEIELDVDTAIPIGLITNELITNSIKHAFSKMQKGKILIGLSKEKNGLLKLNISDNGQATTNESVDKKEKGFGTLLIQLLTTQLGGNMEKSTEGGTSTIIQFPIQEKSVA